MLQHENWAYGHGISISCPHDGQVCNIIHSHSDAINSGVNATDNDSQAKDVLDDFSNTKWEVDDSTHLDDSADDEALLEVLQCRATPGANFMGEVVEHRWPGSANAVQTASDCCLACSLNPTCNLWVFCASTSGCDSYWEHSHCSLKFQQLGPDQTPLSHETGSSVQWVSGHSPPDYSDGFDGMPVPLPLPLPYGSPEWQAPAPQPTPAPTPAESPTPAPEASPTPQPIPFPLPLPYPMPLPVPAPTPTPTPSPQPTPTPTPLPAPAPVPLPLPLPFPYPLPMPNPAPNTLKNVDEVLPTPPKLPVQEVPDTFETPTLPEVDPCAIPPGEIPGTQSNA